MEVCLPITNAISSDDDSSGSQASPSTIIQSGQLIVDSVHSTVDYSGCNCSDIS